RLVTADMSHTTYQTEKNSPIKAHLDEVTDCMKWLEVQEFKKPLGACPRTRIVTKITETL
ncbi:hypothetical protein MNBD_GAMMA04-1909, partial [hydrothermal vent metagenome]